ncbi:MAG: exodeoxyribonuclease III [Candidatus Accumulibacter sp.]|jgi:exodeoxyribonuclease-3|nr:exodeoxyribonuclease III [Accumulibacter sp.]
MKIAAWNVNSLKVRLAQLLDWLRDTRPDVVCLQETKLEDRNFPRAEIEDAAYSCAFSGQKTYNGVALLSRFPIKDLVCDNPFYPDSQKRLIAATIEGVRVVCAYFPNGQCVGSDKYDYKLSWLRGLEEWLGDELARHPRLALAGDFNIAPEDRDVHDPTVWKDQVLCSEPERRAFRRLLELGLKDSFRLFEQPAKSFTWWDYRMLSFQKNLGVRIDHVLLSEALAACCSAAGIDRAMRKRERPSDHAPVFAEIELP